MVNRRGFLQLIASAVIAKSLLDNSIVRGLDSLAQKTTVFLSEVSIKKYSFDNAVTVRTGLPKAYFDTLHEISQRTGGVNG